MGAPAEVLTTELVVDASKAELGVRAYETAVGRAANAAGRLATAGAEASAGTEKTTGALRVAQRVTEQAERALARYVDRFDPAVRAQKQLEQAENAVATARRRGIEVSEQQLRTVELLRERVEAAAQTETKAATAARMAAEAAQRSAEALEQVRRTYDSTYAAQARYRDETKRVSEILTAANANEVERARVLALVAAAHDPAAQAAKREATALNELVGRLEPASAATRKLAEDQAVLDRALASQKIDPSRHAALTRALQEQSRATESTARSSKLAAHEINNLSFQAQDFIVQVGSGQGFFRPFLQQAPQAIGAVGGVSRSIQLLTSPIALAVTGFGVLAGAAALVGGRVASIASEAREMNAELKALNPTLNATAEDLRVMAERVADRRGVARSDATSAIRAIIHDSSIRDAGTVERLAGLSADMGAVTDGKVDAVAAKLTKAFADGIAGIRRLDDEFNFLSESEAEQIRQMARHADQAGALRVAMEALERRFGGAAKAMRSDVGNAFVEMGQAWDAFLERIAKSDFAQATGRVARDVLKGWAGWITPTAPSEEAARKIAETEQALQLAMGRLDKAMEKGATGPGVALLHQQVKTLQTEYYGLVAAANAAQSAQQQATSASSAPPAHRAANDLTPESEATTRQLKWLGEQKDAYARTAEAMRGTAVERQLAVAGLNAEREAIEQKLDPAQKDALVTLRRREALLQLQVAVEDTNRAVLAEIAGNQGLATAYGQSAAAVREATIQAKADQELARGSIETRAQIVTRLRAQEEAQRALNAAQFAANLRDQVADLNRLADAWTRGAAAARKTALANEILAEARKRGLDPNRDRAEIDGISQGVLARETAQRAQSLAQMAAEQQRAVVLANAEFAQLGASNAERARSVAILQTTLDLQDKGADLTAAGTRAYIAQAGELARVQALIAENAAFAGDMAHTIGGSLEKALTDPAAKVGDVWKAAFADIKQNFARAFVTKPLETWLQGSITKLMSGDLPAANTNVPTPANDPGSRGRVMAQVFGGLGASDDNPVWVRLAAGGAALAAPQLASGQPLPVAVSNIGEFDALFSQAGARYGLDPGLLKAVAQVESSLNPAAVNRSSGATGLMQLMPANFGYLRGGAATDPAANIDAGARILKEHLERAGGDMDRALSTYSGHVKTSGASYVAAVRANQQAIAGQTVAVQDLTDEQKRSIDGALAAIQGGSAVTTEAASDLERQLGDFSDSTASAADRLADAQQQAASGAVGFANSAANAGNYLVSGFAQVVMKLVGMASTSSGGGSGALASLGQQQAGGSGGWADYASLASSGYSAVSGSGAATAGGYATGFAQSWAGNQLGLSTAYPVMSSGGQVGTIYAANSAGADFAAGMSSIGAAAPYGMIGGYFGGRIGSASNSYVVGGLSGAAIGVGSMAAGTAAMGAMGMGAAGAAAGGGMAGASAALAAIPVYGWIAAAVLAVVTAILGTQKKSSGPHGYGELTLSNGVASNGYMHSDNGYDDSAIKQMLDGASSMFNGVNQTTGAKLDDKYKSSRGDDFAILNGKEGFTSYVGGIEKVFASYDEALIDGMRRLNKRLMDKGVLTGASDSAVQAINNSKAKTSEEFLKDVSAGAQWGQILKVQGQGYNPFSEQIKAWYDEAKKQSEAMKEQYDDLLGRVVNLGLADKGEAQKRFRTMLEAQLGLDDTTYQPLRGVAAVTEQVKINFEALRGTLAALGYDTEQQQTLFNRLVAKATSDYERMVATASLQGRIGIEQVIDPNYVVNAADRMTLAGLDTTKFPSFTANLQAFLNTCRDGGATVEGLRDIAQRAWNQLKDGRFSTEQYNSIIQAVTESYKTAGSLAARAVEFQKSLFQDRLQYLQQESQRLQQIADREQQWQRSALTSDYSPLSPRAQLDAALSQYREDRTKAQAGDLDAADRIGSERDTVLKLAKDQYATSQGYLDIFNEMTRDSTTLQTTAQRQLSETQRQTAILQQQLSALQAGTQTPFSTLAGQAKDIIGNSLYSTGVDNQGRSLAERFGDTQLTRGEQQAIARLGGYTGGFGQGGHNAFLNTSQASMDLYNQLIGLASSLVGAPRFAAGGDHAGGLRLVGENGPEFEATGAARYWTAAQTRDFLSAANDPWSGGNVVALRPAQAAPVDVSALVAAVDRVAEKLDDLMDELRGHESAAQGQRASIGSATVDAVEQLAAEIKELRPRRVVGGQG